MKGFRFSTLSLSNQFLVAGMGTILLLLIGVVTYMISSSISAKNEQFQVLTNGRSAAVIEKIDRNFYERFGDVQAFAFNKLAKEAVTTDSAASEELKSFINTMVSYYVLYDLMLLCNQDGKVVAVNTMDIGGKRINTKFLIGKNFAEEEWFKACTSATGPEGGAWYSDFMENQDVSTIYSRPGQGMAFAAPIKNSDGQVMGVWYNFANWQAVTTDIRKETEEAIKKSIPKAFILITNAEGTVIDSNDPKHLAQTVVSVSKINEGAVFDFLGKPVSIKDHVVGSKNGTGAYTYKGKQWNAITFVPRATFSIQYLIDNLLVFILVILLLVIIIGIVFYQFASAVSRNIKRLKNDIESIAQGELVEVQSTRMKNEIGTMTVAVKSLVKGLKETSRFAQQIGEGDLSAKFDAISRKDVLSNSLITMRSNLLKIKEMEEVRSWSTIGLAKIGEILRNNYKDSTELYDSIINFVVKYSHSNQGGLFLLNEDSENKIITLVACYAYERKKFLEKQFAVDEGLVGQCLMEQSSIYMTSVPANYTTITSGLGEVTPTAVILVPLKVNDVIVGVLELAALKPYKDYERELIQKFAESIASTISTARVNDRTKQLLEQAQQQTEEMKAQEEEMRQNMEELTATQEEMMRKEQEYLRQIEELETRPKDLV
jgi:GAF domain